MLVFGAESDDNASLNEGEWGERTGDIIAANRQTRTLFSRLQTFFCICIASIFLLRVHIIPCVFCV
jgi:hypothetical protein